MRMNLVIIEDLKRMEGIAVCIEDGSDDLRRNRAPES